MKYAFNFEFSDLVTVTVPFSVIEIGTELHTVCKQFCKCLISAGLTQSFVYLKF